MSNGDGDRVQVVGGSNEQPPGRLPGGVLLILGLVVGLAVGVLLTPSGTPSDVVSEPPVTTTTTVAPAITTTTTVSDSRIERYQAQIEVLESELADAEFELGLEIDPVEYASVVDCDASQGPLYVGYWPGDNYWVGPVGFFRLVEFLSVGDGFLEARVGVEAGDSVTLVVPRSERDRYLLMFPPVTSTRSDMLASGVPAVTLSACEGTATAFRGGFVTTEDYCAPLDVYFGDGNEPERVFLPFGVADCPDGTTPLAKPEPGPVPDVVGSTLREARLAIRLTALVPSVNEGDPIDPEGMVWAREPEDGGTYEQGTVIGLRTCQPADDVVATYQAKLEGTGVTLSNAWMAPSLGNTLDSWYFVSALVTGGPTNGQVATWALPAFGPNSAVDPVNTPDLSFPANEVSQEFPFGDRRYTPTDYGFADWLDIDGAVASQRCVTLSRAG